MSREYKKTRKQSRKHRKATAENIKKANAQQSHGNPLGERTNTIPLQSPTKAINKRLKKENKNLQKKAAESTQKYWNARRRTLKLEKAAAARKADQKREKADSARLRGVVNLLGKSLEDLKRSAQETTSCLGTNQCTP
ncbi:hypothetical protein GALMADRAFT_239651 [Galerina marginata CBS 339.88]|uniref:Uncharacterized protein n=1 Tax=Galerina marginata (strain CBS 339.88) TaxID=685588 RepID=A0A067TEF8_GALM3|nr:hypothetical protein GALMADRAFT_239651 [Galerina marginata CBS 339.88]